MTNPKKQKSKNEKNKTIDRSTHVGSIYPIGIVIEVRSPTALANIESSEP